MNISENLKRLRKERKLSQSEMSEKLGFKSHNAYSHWEIGKTSPNVRDLEKLSEILGASVYEILFGEKVPTVALDRSPKLEELEKEIHFLRRENQLLQSFLREKGVDLGKYNPSELLQVGRIFRGNFVPGLRLTAY